ncbi:DUF1835 domain-containing protein [Conexibacter arvalis]|uniref:DUF1835 domain-containing protein n=1 Tax=Conexibacter arvalis TaxID=912552 RepID=A0A840IDB6_9ACTN|nr:DUF1835 domain-containing protein [Conexibacter arvalis]MBB4662806.1 hypothetical protein [Conexibacter arvalis]
MSALHVTNGDVIVPAVAAAAGVPVGDVVPWRDVLHDGPVPAGLDPAALARVRAGHLAARGWIDEATALAQLAERDRRLADHPPEDEVVLWFEPDLYDALQLAQVCDRLAGRPGPVTRVLLSHAPRADLHPDFLDREPCTPTREPFAALRSPDPRAWEAVPAFARLCEELPEARTGLGRLEAEILVALADGPLDAHELFARVAAREPVPWIGDLPLWALADELAPLVDGAVSPDRPPRYALTAAGEEVRAGRARRPTPERWIGGVQLGPGRPAWAWDAEARRVVRLD